MLNEIFNKHSEGNSETLSYTQASKAIKQVIEEKTRGEYNKLKIDTIIKVMDKKNKGFVTKERFQDLFDILFLLRDAEKRRKRIKEILLTTVSPWRQRVHMIYQHKFYE